MMVGTGVKSYDDMSVSALQELLNITSGNAVTELAEMGIKADISPCFSDRFTSGYSGSISLVCAFIC